MIFVFGLIRLEAIVAHDKELVKDDVSYLTPEKRNIHSFTALEDTAILDILVPNYDESSRFCNFYLEAVDYGPEEEKNAYGPMGIEKNPNENILNSMTSENTL